MEIRDILNITIEEAKKTYEQMNIYFVIRDGKLKGFSIEKIRANGRYLKWMQ